MFDNLNQVTSSFEEKAKTLPYSDSRWIFKSPWIFIAKNKGEPLLTRLDNTIAKMPNGERAKLKKRFSDIIPNNATKFVREYDDQFLEATVEILGWGWLKDRYPSGIPQFTQGTPDLVVKDNPEHVIAAMECKKIRSSEEDRNYYANKQCTAASVKESLKSNDYAKNPFLRKLGDTLRKAEEQLEQCDSINKFIFLDLAFDTQLTFDQLKPTTIDSISNLARELRKKGICLVSFEQFNVAKPITGLLTT